MRNPAALAAVGLLLLTIPSTPVFAGKTDSLRKIAFSPTSPDTSKVMAYAGLAWEFKNRDTNEDSVLHYATKGLQLAKEIGFGKGIALCEMHLGIAHMLKQEYAPALQHLNNALAYYEPQGAGKELNEVYHNIGVVYYMQTKLGQAITYFEKSEKIAAAIGNNSRLARACFYQGDIYNDQGSFGNALQQYLKAMKLYEAGGNKSSAANCYTNIATLYAQLKDFDQARTYVNKSLEEFSHANNVQEVYQNYSNIGFVYSLMADYPRALELFSKGERLTDSLGDEYWNTVFLSNIAEIYTTSGKPAAALATYKKVLERNEKVQDVNFTLSAHSGMGRILYAQGNKKEGIAHMQQALQLMQENGLKKLVMGTAAELADMYDKQGDYKNALSHTRLSNTYKDSIFNADNEKKIQQIQFDNELEQKQQQITLLNKNKEQQATYTSRLKIILVILVISEILLITMLVLFYRKRSAEIKARRKVQGQKEKLQEQAAKLEELNKFKDKTFSVLSHDLRGPINSITAAIQMLNNKQLTAEEYATLKPEINNQLGTLNLLLDNVLMWARSYMQETKASDPGPTDLNLLVSQNVSLLTETAERKQITLTSTITSPVMVICDGGQVNIVLRNLIMNALKYTGKGGKVTISSEQHGNMVRLIVADNGVGMDTDQLHNLFTAKDGRNTYGTDGEKGIGLGLLLCYEFIRVNNGDITATSTPGAGSTLTVALPAVQ